MARCLIACGSNQGRPRQQLDDARDLLRAMPGVTLVAASRARETRPIGGPAGQPPFLNGAFLVETDLTPIDMLGVLTAIENTLHRERSEWWGPRTIDLDLLLYDDHVIEQSGLTVPHPRMVTRRFVLEPCAEIARDFVHPLAGCSIGDLLDNISVAHPHVAVVGVAGSGASEVAAAVAGSWLDTALLDPHDVLSSDTPTPPHVVILVVAEAASVGAAISLQNTLRHHLLSPASSSTRRAKAVVVVEANDLSRAIGEAVAAVEAMA